MIYSTTQMMEAMATLKVSSTTKRATRSRPRWIVSVKRWRPLWHGMQSRVQVQLLMGAPERFYRTISFGVYERPSVPFGPGTGEGLRDISQHDRDQASANDKLNE